MGLRPARIAVTAYFCLFGVVLAVWITRIPAIKERLHLSDGVLGVALFAIPAGLLLVTLFAGRLVDRFGSAWVTRVAGVAMAVTLIPPAVAGRLGWLMAALFVFGVSAGALDVGMNSNGILLERARGRPVMTSLHAGYSIGALAGAVIGGLFAGAGIGPLPTFLAVGLPSAVVGVAGGRWLLTEHTLTEHGIAGDAGSAADTGRTDQQAGIGDPRSAGRLGRSLRPRLLIGSARVRG